MIRIRFDGYVLSPAEGGTPRVNTTQYIFPAGHLQSLPRRASARLIERSAILILRRACAAARFPEKRSITTPVPIRTIAAAAPIRICDNGGWTDTWFAGHGRVFNIAVTPAARARIRVFPPEKGKPRILLRVLDFDESYALPAAREEWGPHPLLEAAIDHVGVPEDCRVEISVSCDAPAGASTGTSAAVTVTLLGALAALGGRALPPQEAAMQAHHVETNLLGRQCGIQDQICSAHGGINLITVEKFPRASVERLEPDPEALAELQRRIALVYLGRGHSSSEVHEAVIRGLESEGPSSPRLEALRVTARLSAEALMQGDLAALGRAMRDNTEAQERLHPALICPDAKRIIRIAREGGAYGWKVNGAGGEGGSLTLLCGGSPEDRRTLLEVIRAANPHFRLIPVALSAEGLRVRESIP